MGERGWTRVSSSLLVFVTRVRISGCHRIVSPPSRFINFDERWLLPLEVFALASPAFRLPLPRWGRGDGHEFRLRCSCSSHACGSAVVTESFLHLRASSILMSGGYCHLKSSPLRLRRSDSLSPDGGEGMDTSFVFVARVRHMRADQRLSPNRFSTFAL